MCWGSSGSCFPCFGGFAGADPAGACGSADRHADFCIGVVWPFFSMRLTDQRTGMLIFALVLYGRFSR